MDLNMSKEPRQNLANTNLLADEFKKIGDRSGSTIRICVSLTESTKSNCPELNFIELSTNKQNENKTCLDPFGKELDKEDEEIKKIADSFNEKYGVSKKKTRRKIFMGLGEGYNLEDSFIDDGDAYEEEIPWEYDPLHVGYYINKGTLLCTNEPAKTPVKGENVRRPEYRAPNDGDDDEDEDDDDMDEIRGRKKMRLSDDEEPNEPKKRRIQLTDIKTTICHDNATNNTNNDTKKDTNTNNNKIHSITNVTNITDTVANINNNTKTIINNKNNKVTSKVNNNNNNNNNTNDGDIKLNTISLNDTIGNSHLSGSENKSINKNNKLKNNNNNKSILGAKESEANSLVIEELKTDVIKEMTRLKALAGAEDSSTKHLFTPDVLNKLSSIYSACQGVSLKSKMRLFEAFTQCSGVSKESIFKKVKKHCLDLNKQKSHIAKNLLKQGVDEVMPGLMEKHKRQVAERDRLRQQIKDAMTLNDTLHKQDGGNGEKQDGGNGEKQNVGNGEKQNVGNGEKQNVGNGEKKNVANGEKADDGENGLKKDGGKQDGVEPSSGESNDGAKVDSKSDLKRHVIPRKKFTWSVNTRGKLRELVDLCMLRFEASRIKSQSAEDYLKAFLDTDVLCMWPPGWMQTRILLKESRSSHIKWTSEPNKSKVIKVKKQYTPKRVQLNTKSFLSPITTTTSSTNITTTTSTTSTAPITTSSFSPQTLSSAVPGIPNSQNCTFAPSSVITGIGAPILTHNNSVASLNTSCLQTNSHLINVTTYDKSSVANAPLKLAETHQSKAPNHLIPTKPIIINIDDFDVKPTTSYNSDASNNQHDAHHITITNTTENSTNLNNSLASDSGFTAIKIPPIAVLNNSVINLTDESLENNINNVHKDTSSSIMDTAVQFTTSKTLYSNQVVNHSNASILPHQTTMMQSAQSFIQPQTSNTPKSLSNKAASTHAPTFTTPHQLSSNPQQLQQYLKHLQEPSNKPQYKDNTLFSNTMPAFKRPSAAGSHGYHLLGKKTDSNNFTGSTASNHQSKAIQHMKMQTINQFPKVTKQQLPLQHQQLLPNTTLGFNQPQ